MNNYEVKVGVIGFGTVGAGVCSNLLRNGEMMTRRTGIKLTLAAVADLDIESDRGVEVPKDLLTTDADSLIEKVDVVVELVGGTTFAADIIMKALKAGKPVVTANKALLAEKGEMLFKAAQENNVDIYYEAAVAGGIPVIKALREGLAANRIERIYGIMNGTCNYILTRMEREGADFEPILKDAQALGYAEAEPSLDVDGFDTAHKAAILAALAYGKWFGMEAIHVEGIRDISLLDLKFADELGYRIKLLAVIKQDENDDIQIRVHPTLLPKTSLPAGIMEVFNGVMITGDTVGDTLFYGRGAGRDATASAVVADLLDVALNIKMGSAQRVPAFRPGAQFRHLLPMDSVVGRYYLRLHVVDNPGVVATVSKILGNNGISISSIVQHEGYDSADSVPLMILTHEIQEKHIHDAINQLEQQNVVKAKVKLLRIEDI